MSISAVPYIGFVTRSKPSFAEVRASCDSLLCRQVVEKRMGPEIIVTARRRIAVHFWQFEAIHWSSLNGTGKCSAAAARSSITGTGTPQRGRTDLRRARAILTAVHGRSAQRV